MRQIALYREISGPAARQPKTDRLILAKLLDRASKDFRIEEDEIAAAHRVLLRWAEMETSGQLGTFNETQLQGMLLAQVFGEALGYAQPTDSPELWHQEQHRSTGPGQTPDAALGRRATMPLTENWVSYCAVSG